MRHKIILFVAVFVFLAITAFTAKQMFPRNASLSSPVVNGSREQRWQADLTWLRDTLPQKHINLFFNISQTDFQNRMNALIASVPDSDDRTLMGELIKTVNSIGDMHTNATPNVLSVLPISFFFFEEGIFVNMIDVHFFEFYGQKLTAVEGIPIEQILERLQPFTHRNNTFSEKNGLSNLLRVSEVLYLAGIAYSTSQIRYTFGDNDLTVSRVKWEVGDAKLENVEKFPPPEQRLLSQRNSDKYYWFERLDNDVLYIKYNSCRDMKDYPVSAFITDIFKEIDKKDVKKIVVDLRDNGGGNSQLFDPFISKMEEYPKLNTSENFKIIIGRRTFSSGILNAWHLKTATQATFVGEPTGDRVNRYGQAERLSLSNVDVIVQYSTKYFKLTHDDPDALYPDVSVKLRAEEWFCGEDAFLEAALR